MRRPGVVVDAVRRVPAAGALAPFDAAVRETWSWSQPSWSRRHWTLQCGERVVATLDPLRTWGPGLVARFASGALILPWAFARGARVLREGETTPIASYLPHWLRGGRIESGADRLKFRMAGFLAGVYELRTSDDLLLVSFRPRRMFLRKECQLELEDAARTRDDLAALLVLGWYVVLSRRSHAH